VSLFWWVVVGVGIAFVAFLLLLVYSLCALASAADAYQERLVEQMRRGRANGEAWK
jgi:hypothetical protein